MTYILGCAHGGVWSISYKRNHNFVWVALLVFQKHLRNKCLLNCKFPLLFYVVCNESNFYANLISFLESSLVNKFLMVLLFDLLWDQVSEISICCLGIKLSHVVLATFTTESSGKCLEVDHGGILTAVRQCKLRLPFAVCFNKPRRNNSEFPTF